MNHILILGMLDALDVVLMLPRDLNLPRNSKILKNLNQVPSSLRLPGTVKLAVFHILAELLFDMLGALHVVLIVVLNGLNLPRNPGTVTLAVFRILLFDMLGALRVVLLLLNLRHNVKLAVSRYHLTIISPAVWNADPHEE
jgi:hypothetical protein